MKLKRTMLMLLVVLFALGCRKEAGIEEMAIPVHNCTTPQDRHRWNWWTRRHESFNEIAKKGGIDLVFLGDSIMQQWESEGKEVWDKYYGPRNAANFGISGDCTQHVIWRIDNGNFDGIKPKLVVLLIGTNNCRYDTPRQIADGVAAIVRRLRIRLPMTKILLLGIFPMGQRPDDPARAGAEAANAIFRKIADGKMIHYLDIGDKFLDENGAVSQEIMPDFVHPSPRGYEIWAEAIEGKVAELMGER